MAHNEMHASHASEELHHEPLPVKVYVGVFVGLLFLTFVTVAIAGFDFGDFNMVVAMAVALTKASLVVLYFMNLKHDHDRLNGVIFLTGLFFLVVFIGPTMWDAFTRDALDPDRARAVEMAPPAAPAAPAAAQ
ncbi:cytochrome C oxidase subunit IV family protein [Vulgatibacter sp.]|uniref:cytochrome C oxidase subunit IV family protein n=1 Tax=Vulgatibacter sp. TaxID=1971226 RepID=UPI00356178C3